MELAHPLNALPISREVTRETRNRWPVGRKLGHKRTSNTKPPLVLDLYEPLIRFPLVARKLVTMRSFLGNSVPVSRLCRQPPAELALISWTTPGALPPLPTPASPLHPSWQPGDYSVTRTTDLASDSVAWYTLAKADGALAPSAKTLSIPYRCTLPV